MRTASKRMLIDDMTSSAGYACAMVVVVVVLPKIGCLSRLVSSRICFLRERTINAGCGTRIVYYVGCV